MLLIVVLLSGLVVPNLLAAVPVVEVDAPCASLIDPAADDDERPPCSGSGDEYQCAYSCGMTISGLRFDPDDRPSVAPPLFAAALASRVELPPLPPPRP